MIFYPLHQPNPIPTAINALQAHSGSTHKSHRKIRRQTTIRSPARRKHRNAGIVAAKESETIKHILHNSHQQRKASATHCSNIHENALQQSPINAARIPEERLADKIRHRNTQISAGITSQNHQPHRRDLSPTDHHANPHHINRPHHSSHLQTAAPIRPHPIQLQNITHE